MTIFSKPAIFPQITAAGSAAFCSEAAIAMQSSPSVCRVRRPCSDRWMETKGKHKRCSFGPDLCRAMIYGYSQSFLWSLSESNQRDLELKVSLMRRHDTVDGWNPAPVDMVSIPLFTGFYTSQVVQDFSHQQYDMILTPPPALGTFLYDAAVTQCTDRGPWQVTSTGPSGKGYTFNLTWVSLTTARLDWILLARRLMSCVMCHDINPSTALEYLPTWTVDFLE